MKLEPIEEVICEVADEFSGAVIEALTVRKAEVSGCSLVRASVLSPALIMCHAASVCCTSWRACLKRAALHAAFLRKCANARPAFRLLNTLAALMPSALLGALTSARAYPAAGDDDAGERGQAAARVPVPIAWTDRVPSSLRHPDAGLWADAPRVPRVWAVPGPHGSRSKGGAHLHGGCVPQFCLRLHNSFRFKDCRCHWKRALMCDETANRTCQSSSLCMRCMFPHVSILVGP